MDSEDAAPGTGVAQEALGCGVGSRIDGLRLTPDRVTPDGNGVFDEARIEASIRVEHVPAAALLAREGFLFELRWEVTAARVTGGGDTVNGWTGREFVTPGVSDFDDVGIPIRAVWDGRDRSGTTVPVGEYVVTASARLGLLPPLLRRWVPLGPQARSNVRITVAGEPDAQETAVLGVAAIRERIGRRLPVHEAADETLVDGAYLYETATPQDLRDLSLAVLAVDGVDPDARFELLRAALLSDPEIEVAPTEGMIAAWRSAYLESGGRVDVEWTNAGTPGHIRGLDAGVLAGTLEEVASAYLERFDAALGGMFGVASGEVRRLRRSAVTDDTLFSAVTYDHLVEGVIDPQGDPVDGEAGSPDDGAVDDPGQSVLLPVLGDHLTLHVRHAGMPAGAGRVMAVTASWSPVPAPLPVRVRVAPPTAGLAAVAAVDFPNGEVIRQEGPFLVFPEPGVWKARYDVWVARATEVRRVTLDAITGQVEHIVDGIERYQARVVAPYAPVAFPDDATDGPPWDGYLAHDRLDWDHGVPLLILTGSDGRQVVTGTNGSFETTDLSWPVTVTGFDGTKYSQWELDVDNGLLFPPLRQTFYPAATLRLSVGPAWALGSANPAMSRPAKDQFIGMLYAHANYVRDLLDRGGADTEWGDVNLLMEWAPRGKKRCNQRADCIESWPGADPGSRTGAGVAACDSSTGHCSWDHWYDSDDGDDNYTCDLTDLNDGAKDCDSDYQNFMCDTTVSTGDGWCGYTGGDPGGTGHGCFDFVQRRFVDTARRCIGIERGTVRCEDEGGCWDPALGLTTPFLDPRPYAESYAVRVLAHEVGHAAVGRSRWLARASGEHHGRLAGFLSEAMPNAISAVVYDDFTLWDDRLRDDPAALGSRFGGDPVGGGNDCPDGPEPDDPADDFVCPENDYTCGTAQACAERLAACDAPPGGSCPAPGCAVPGGRQLVCDGTRAYGVVDIHENGHWFVTWFIRYAALVGRRAAIQGLAALLSDPIDRLTVVAGHPNSVYYKFAWPSGSSVAVGRARSRSYEAYRAFRWGITPGYRWIPEVAERAINRYDDWTSSAYHGETAPPHASPWNLGEQRVTGVAGDVNDDHDEFAFWFWADETYEIRISATPATRTVTPFYRIPPGDPDGGLGFVAFLPAVTGSGTWTIRFPQSGYRHFGALAESGEPWVRYEIAVAMIGDDHADRADDAVLLPPMSASWPVVGEISGADLDVFRVFVHPTERVNLRAEVIDGIISPSGPAVRFTVRDAAGAIVTDRVFGTLFAGLQTGVTLAAAGGAQFYELTLSLTSPGGSGRVRYAVSTAPAVAGGAPRLQCDSAVLAAGATPPPQCTLDGAGPLVSGVLHRATHQDHLWFYGREGRTYTLRLDGDFARARLHHPTFRGTSTDAATLFELTPTRLERTPEGRGGPSATFEAPVTGWYRLTVRGIPATSPTIGNPYPEPYTVRFAEGPVRMPDLPEIPEWAGR